MPRWDEQIPIIMHALINPVSLLTLPSPSTHTHVCAYFYTYELFPSNPIIIQSFVTKDPADEGSIKLIEDEHRNSNTEK